jgi:large subunit ribosomal protein L24
MNIKKGDTVKVITGKDKGKTGRVLVVDRDANRVQVEGVAILKRHVKPGRFQSTPDGGIIEKPGTIHASNVMVVDPASQLPTRVGHKFEGDKKVRVGRGKSAGAVLDTK